MRDYECPYCEFPDDFDGDPLGQDETIEVTCTSCEKVFLITADYSVSYDTEKADCLNDLAPHEFKDIVSSTKAYGGQVRVRCDGCREEKSRPATLEEMLAEPEYNSRQLEEAKKS